MKVVGSYSSVVRGVSEQVPQDRHPGQHYEQVNMVSDPVRGVMRRHGSVMLDEVIIPGASPDLDAARSVLRMYRTQDFFIKGKEYTVLYRSLPSADTQYPLVKVYDREAGKFLDTIIDADASMAPFKAQGLVSLTNAGQYIVAAGNNLVPGYTSTDQVAPHSTDGVCWIKAGAYSRTFTVTVHHTNGNTYTASYTTMASSYPTLLDTSGIPAFDDPPTNSVPNKNYQKQINDAVNAYNSAVNAWVGQAAADQQPANIAAKLRAALIANGMPGTDIGYVSSTLVFANTQGISATDGGNGDLVQVVMDELKRPEDVSTIHITGKVIKITVNGAAEPYYLKAVNEDGDPTVRWTKVKWVECPATLIQPTTVFMLGYINPTTGKAYFAASQARLQTIAGITGVPPYQPNVAGDLTAQLAKPYFLDHPISMLTMFQDRLCVVSNGTVFFSRSGDYFNWFRSSMLNYPDDDPVEVYALGSEDDIISKSVTYNKDLFLFGRKNQYTVSGRTPITPSLAAISPTASEKYTTESQPVVIGNLLFYGKYDTAKTQAGPSPYAGAVSQFQLGVFQDTPETYKASVQLDRYIRGRPIEFATLSSPAYLFVRTDGNDNGLYTYTFIDAPTSQQREFDSWSRWSWHAQFVGQIIGLTTYQSNLVVFTAKSDGTNMWWGAEQFTVDSNLSDTPYLDSQRYADVYEAGSGYLKPSYTEALGASSVAIDVTQDTAWLGAEMDKYEQFLTQYPSVPKTAMVVGLNYADECYVDITPPYVRDQNDRAIVNGDVTVGQYTLSVTDTGGFDAYRTSENVTTRVMGFNGRVLGRVNNLVGRQPITTTRVQVPCGKANIRHRMKFRARTWLPMGISAIEWVGQLFMNSKRV